MANSRPRDAAQSEVRVERYHRASRPTPICAQAHALDDRQPEPLPASPELLGTELDPRPDVVLADAKEHDLPDTYVVHEQPL
jgi:hypothetical protein